MEKGSIRHGNVETLPRFIRNLRDLRCCDGDAITLECHVEALPEPIIIWEKDGRVLPSGKDFDMFYDGIKATLRIPRVYPEDEGEYTCIAKNNIGRTLSSACIIVDVPEEKENMVSRQLSRPSGLLSASSTPRSTPRSTPNRSFSPMRLSYRHSSIDFCSRSSRAGSSGIGLRRAIAAPKFLAIPHNRVVEEGESVRFQCAISGHPTPWSTWDKDGMIVTPTGRIAVKEIDDLRFLEIDEVSFDDAGLYRITLENDYGRIEATARLDVISSSRYSRSPSVRGIRASSSRRNAHIRRRIMGPSTAIGGRMALATGFRGSSVPSCKFYHNGSELEESERVSVEVIEGEAFLYIENVNEQDEGLYSCIIQGDHEPLVTSTLVKFQTNCGDELTSSINKQPHIIRELPEITEYLERETIDLSFEFDCADQPYTYVWSRNGEILADDEDFNYIDHGNGLLCLRIHDAFDLDSGLYACEVHTTSGCICRTSGQLAVIESSDHCHSNLANDEDLLLLKTPLTTFATVGAEASFCARVHPCNATACWFVCGHEIKDDSPEFKLEESTDGVRILRVLDVQYKHCGEVQLCVSHPGNLATTTAPAITSLRTPSFKQRSYTSLIVIPSTSSSSSRSNSCSSSNNNSFTTETLVTTHSEEQQEEVKLELKNKDQELLVPACILEGPEDCTAFIGASVKLRVTYKAQPRAQVKWFKACRPIVESECKSSNIVIKTNEHQSTLLISDIAADDSGKYTVEVMNEFNMDIAVASVAVEGTPDPPSGKPSISQGPDRVAVAWCGPPYDGGCMITGFIIEMQELTALSAAATDSCKDNSCTAEWQEIATVVDSLAYTVKNLTPNGIYRFRVRAENVHGRSEPGLPSDRVEIVAREVPTENFQGTISVKAGGDFKSRFDILEELGKGRFGIVYKVQEKTETRQVLAAKVIKCIKSRDRQKVQEEISIMTSLKHPKLLQLAASFENPREIIMVMEYITGGELFERVVADDFTLTELDCILFLRQVCEGVDYMHSQSIVHLDLKPENIMCHTRTSHQIKIIDFGLAQRLNTDASVRVLFGTPEFIPPEIISYEPIGFQSDMWSIGVICYVLLSGLSPFMGDSDVETFANITRADYDFDDEAFDCVSQEAKDFISNLLVHRKEDRWTAKQCLQAKWITQGHDENLSNNKICTDKLKKFIIRRKWQKTGNAIRALGRMATLSASRRNSAISASGSLPSSPRPSISGVSMFNPNISVQMSSLHEEDDDFSIELPKTVADAHKRIMQKTTLRVRDKSQCSERSDSGYSECSNCSGAGGNISTCQCVPQAAKEYEKDLLEVTTAISTVAADGAAESSLLSVAIPHDVLKSKLEQIAKHVEHNSDEERASSTKSESADLDSNCILKKLVVPQAVSKADMAEQQKESQFCDANALNKLEGTRKMEIMRSDFTNTIKMRKKSLENNALRDKLKFTLNKAPLLESCGKVSKLKSKFSGGNVSDTGGGGGGVGVEGEILGVNYICGVSSSDCIDVASKLYKSKDCMDIAKSKSVFTRSACDANKNDSTAKIYQQQSVSMPNSPRPARSTTPIRLSNRVKEATERLAQQHTISSAHRSAAVARRSSPEQQQTATSSSSSNSNSNSTSCANNRYSRKNLST